MEELYISQSKAVGWSALEAMPELICLYVSETDSLPGFGMLARCETLQQKVEELFLAGTDSRREMNTLIRDVIDGEGTSLSTQNEIYQGAFLPKYIKSRNGVATLRFSVTTPL